jgi:hypothetical protein
LREEVAFSDPVFLTLEIGKNEHTAVTAIKPGIPPRQNSPPTEKTRIHLPFEYDR